MTRHSAIQDIMKFFAFAHLPQGILQDVSQRCCELAYEMYNDEELDGAELTVGLRKLLEAKDCFVRSALK